MIEHFSLGLFVVLIITGFVAGYIDAVAGGGGMIQALALLMVGIAPLNTLATNKIVSLSGTVTAVIRYAQGLDDYFMYSGSFCGHADSS